MKFRVMLERTETLNMMCSVTVEAGSEAAARRKALAWARDEDNENEWSESGGGGSGRPRITSIGERP